MINQKYTVTPENFETLNGHLQNSRLSLDWKSLFILPKWNKAWWTAFGNNTKLKILSIRMQEEIIGLAPLQVMGDRALFIGGANVCDYLDFIIAAGKEETFFNVLLDHLDRQGIKHLELGLLRPDSTVIADLVGIARNQGRKVTTTSEDISLELELPATWEEYLAKLNAKQRHEVKRKFRRLHEAGDINLRVVEDAKEIEAQMPVFFELFRMSSGEKAAFMTDQMASFFHSLAVAMAESKILKLYFLDLNTAPVAASMCFDFNATLHLYNSGFDPRFRALSAGLLCKVLTIRDAIEKGREKYDFLKGAETYKYRLGGREVPLYTCQIEL